MSAAAPRFRHRPFVQAFAADAVSPGHEPSPRAGRAAAPGVATRRVARNFNMFWSLAQARVVISDWKEDYNHRRRHCALGYQEPAVYAAARTHP
jgi:transposase InsO family protein